jgi:DNA-binding LacI/PurR family transcriptional regulator
MDKSRLPTSDTISRITGVSKSTVSRALKGHPSISAATRERVVAVARELGYAPNAVARSLVTRRSGVIGFIIGDMSNPFYPEQLERLLRLLALRDMQLMMFHIPPGQDVADIIPVLLQYQLDGCLVASVELSSRAGDLGARHGLPTVLINRIPANHHACAVLCNNRAGGERIARFFVERGVRRLAFVAGKALTSTSRDREAGFMAGIEATGTALFARAVGDYTFEGGYRAGLDLLALPERPDAVFSANDIMALGLLDALRAQGVAVPAEIAVAGFDDIRAASWPAYDLTTITQPIDTLLLRAIDLLAQRIADPTLPPETLYVTGQLTIRGSAC